MIIAQAGCVHGGDADAASLWDEFWPQAASGDSEGGKGRSFSRATVGATTQDGNRAKMPDLDPGIGVILDPAPPLNVANADAIASLKEAQLALIALVERGLLREIYTEGGPPRENESASVYFVQIGAHRAEIRARDQLDSLRARYERFRAFGTRVQYVDLAERGRFFRAHFGPVDSAYAARTLCGALEGIQEACVIVAERPAALKPTATAPPITRRDSGSARLVQTAELHGAADGRIHYRPEREARGSDTAGADGMPIFTSPGLPGLDD